MNTNLKEAMLTNEFPPILFDVVQVTSVSWESITMSGSIDTSPSELLRFLIGQIPTVTLI